MAGSSHVIVWEFQADIPGMFTPYSDKISNHVEDQYSQDPTRKVLLGQIDAVLKDYSIELGTMMQTNCQRPTQRPVRRQIYDNTTAIGNGIIWQWLTDIGWISYDVDTLNEIENAFSRNEDVVDLEQLQYSLPNIVLIQKGYQKNKHTNFVRPIQRKDTNYKSVSSTSNVAQPGNSASAPTVMQNAVPTSNVSSNSFASASAVNSNPTSNPSVGVPLYNSHRRNKHSRKKHGRSAPSSSRNHRHRTHGFAGGGLSPATPLPPQTFDVLKYCDITEDIEENEDCPICLLSLKDSDGGDGSVDEDNDDDKLMEDDPIVKLKKCKHQYHKSCMEAYCKQGLQNGCIQCPICKVIHGIKTGFQPPGKMDVFVNHRSSVAGYEGDGMITITYTIHSGMQGPNHPHPNTPYNAVGFPRVAYLPANEKGEKVLRLLKIAWERKLIFTVAASTTTGMDNCVVWNEIHHKTSPRDNGSGHGFPDPTYLDNVIDELKQHGVVDEDET